MKNNLVAYLFYTLLFVSSITTFAADTITVISHNVLAFSGHPTKIHKTDHLVVQQAIEFYRKTKADIILLSESPSEETIRILADSLNYHYAFYTANWNGNTEYPYGFPGCILTKFPISKSIDYNKDRNNIADSLFQRFWGSCYLTTKYGKARITGVHLCANFDRNRESNRIAELNLLFTNIDTCNDCAFDILAGDFNSLPNSTPYQLIVNKKFVDSHNQYNYPTVPVPSPKVCIDYIFIYENLKANYKQIPTELPYNENTQKFLSDHYPCMVQLIFK